ncbi:MAG: ATP-binding cassette domain-containing protein [Halothiobacillus sp.]|nr:ATP-binding cassette domain-containing protein [Halothiobacillus sp.]
MSDLAVEVIQAIIIDGVSKSFGKPPKRTDALIEVSLSVQPGQVTGLIGPDAAGKTTLMRLICGLLTADAGTLTVLGFNAPPRRCACKQTSGTCRSTSDCTKT